MRAGKHKPGCQHFEITICDNCGRSVSEHQVWIDLRQELTKGKQFCGMSCNIDFLMHKEGRVFKGWREAWPGNMRKGWEIKAEEFAKEFVNRNLSYRVLEKED